MKKRSNLDMIGADMFKLCCNNKNNVYVYFLYTLFNRTDFMKVIKKADPRLGLERKTNEYSFKHKNLYTHGHFFKGDKYSYL